MDLRVALMCGIDIPCVGLGVTLHQPKIKEIAFIGEKDFFNGVQCLCIDKNMLAQDKTLLQNTSNFQIFMTIMNEAEAKEKKQAVQQLLQLIFPSYKIFMSPRSIILQGGANGNINIDQENFIEFQSLIKEIFCWSLQLQRQDNFNPADAKAREIAEKLMRGRKRVAEIKGETNNSIFASYLSILTIGLNSMSLEDLMNLTMYQIYDLYERYSLYINWDIDIRSRLAGAKPENQPDNWMKNLH